MSQRSAAGRAPGQSSHVPIVCITVMCLLFASLSCACACCSRHGHVPVVRMYPCALHDFIVLHHIWKWHRSKLCRAESRWLGADGPCQLPQGGHGERQRLLRTDAVLCHRRLRDSLHLPAPGVPLPADFRGWLFSTSAALERIDCVALPCVSFTVHRVT